MLFPDVTDLTERFRDRNRTCHQCGWIEHLLADGTPYQPPTTLDWGDGESAGRTPLVQGRQAPGTWKPRDGCHVSKDCTACPLSLCRHEAPAPYAAWLLAQGNRPRIASEDIDAEMARTGSNRANARQNLSRRLQRLKEAAP